jgi:hypothetical protein
LKSFSKENGPISNKVGGIPPRVKAVKANPDYTLTLTFTNDEVKLFDVKPYLDKGIFRELQDVALFNMVRPFLESIQWKNGQDFCPDTLYLDGVSSPSAVKSATEAEPRPSEMETQS